MMKYKKKERGDWSFVYMSVLSWIEWIDACMDSGVDMGRRDKRK